MNKELIERLRSFESDHTPEGWPAIKMKEISALLEMIDKLNAEVQEQARLLGISAERELSLLSQLAASQAREAKLREALNLALREATASICSHDETYRGGAIWEICRQCGEARQVYGDLFLISQYLHAGIEFTMKRGQDLLGIFEAFQPLILGDTLDRKDSFRCFRA